MCRWKVTVEIQDGAEKMQRKLVMLKLAERESLLFHNTFFKINVKK